MSRDQEKRVLAMSDGSIVANSVVAAEQFDGWSEMVESLKNASPSRNGLPVRQMASLRKIVRRMKVSSPTVLDPIVAAKLAQALES